ncbi:MAG TPA: hypothetical protein PLN25_05940 [Deltaproteobacteria bacterium]|nr:hypothetical protein [Deltaproteobacteria bacterium]HQB39592.1 hypothetical protein [Deltaproteobacteria bacterium]
MKSRRITLLLSALILMFATIACASDMGRRIDRAYIHIDRGIKSGSITRDEARRLKRELSEVRETEDRMTRDGRLDRRERERLDRKLDRLEKHIYQAKSNDRVAPGRDQGYRDQGYRDQGPSHFGVINVISGSYGQNCGAPQGNVTAHLAEQCNGQKVCKYRIYYKVIGDPKPGCAKDYVATWRCGNGPVRSASAPPEAGTGSIVTLTCPR